MRRVLLQGRLPCLIGRLFSRFGNVINWLVKVIPTFFCHDYTRLFVSTQRFLMKPLFLYSGKLIIPLWIKNQRGLDHGPILPSLISFAFTNFTIQYLQQLYNTADILIVGVFLDKILGGSRSYDSHFWFNYRFWPLELEMDGARSSLRCLVISLRLAKAVAATWFGCHPEGLSCWWDSFVYPLCST